MHPSTELNQLSARKAVLRQRIATQRRDCVNAARTLARPLAWLDRAAALGRQFAPIARAALGPLGIAWEWFRHRSARPAKGRRWLPLIVTALQLFSRWSNNRPR